MKTLVTYYSLTGNTEKLALAIFNEISGDKSLLRFSDVSSLDYYDLVFIGFPVYNFGPVAQAVNFINSYAKGKNIALFTTMSLKAAPENDQTRKLYEATIENCLKCSINANVLDIFDCPGELSENAANALLNSGDPMLKLFGSMRPLTIGYPTEKNISDARLFAIKVFQKLRKNETLTRT